MPGYFVAVGSCGVELYAGLFCSYGCWLAGA